ncbi:MAG: hydroxymethylbilane synthase, partial [Pseudomonadota bacterium]
VYSGAVDATILAAAGLRRLGIEPEQAIELPLSQWLPAPGQGVIVVQCRTEDERVRHRLAAIQSNESMAVVTAERAVIQRLGGDCRMPLAAWAEQQQGLILRARLGDLNGRLIDAEGRGEVSHAARLGLQVAEQLIEQGGDELLQSLE